MKRRCLLALVAVALVPTGILGAGIVLIRQSKVPPDAIASSVTRTPELVERAWRLPVAATFNRQLTWQSIVSRCGPAAVANIYRSLKEAAATEAKVLIPVGGAGPLQAASIAENLRVPRVLVPIWPGVTSALGCLLADIRYDDTWTVHMRLDQIDP